MPALHDIVQKGSTDRSVVVHIMDSADGTPETGVVFNTSGIDLWYRREGAARVAITEATLAALTTAHADGGFLHVSDGDYRLDLPDAAFATGANYVDFGGTVTGMIVVGGRVRLIDASFEVANLAANVTQWLGSAAATPTVAGVPEVDVTHWIGTAAATPTVAGVPEVDITHFGGSAGTFASGIPAVNSTQISGDSTAADNLELSYDDTAGAVAREGIIDQGTAQSATSTTLVLRAAAAFADDEIIGATILITGGSAGVGQARLITDYVSTTDTATVETWTTTPTGTITYKIFATAPGSGGAGLDAAGVRAAVGLASANLDTQLSTIDTVVDAILVDTGTTLDGRIPAALVSGRMDASVGAMATNVITAAATATDFTTEVTSGLATAAALATVDDFLDTEVAAILAAVDTEVAAIKAKTDSLTFTVANVVDANLQRINDVAVTGDGSGTPFGV